jgi:AAA+ superfamily predicted ATPase
MALLITTADQRLATKRPCNIALFAPPGWGKTFQARTLPAEETLFLDAEAGTLALGDWGGATLDIRGLRRLP